MEKILWLYSQPYDSSYPVVCFDERPCFLIGDKVNPIPMQSGQAQKLHYAYEKNGSCALLAAIEPLTGLRVAKIYNRRTQKEYTDFMQIISNTFPYAQQICLVQDNLNTHYPKSFYKYLEAQKAAELARRFEWFYTPKSASWLNMIEIEFSALARQCLNRRIATKEQLEKQVLAIVEERNDKKIKINWQFSCADARKKLNRHYCKINPDNLKYK